MREAAGATLARLTGSVAERAPASTSRPAGLRRWAAARSAARRVRRASRSLLVRRDSKTGPSARVGHPCEPSAASIARRSRRHASIGRSARGAAGRRPCTAVAGRRVVEAGGFALGGGRGAAFVESGSLGRRRRRRGQGLHCVGGGPDRQPASPVSPFSREQRLGFTRIAGTWRNARRYVRATPRGRLLRRGRVRGPPPRAGGAGPERAKRKGGAGRGAAPFGGTGRCPAKSAAVVTPCITSRSAGKRQASCSSAEQRSLFSSLSSSRKVAHASASLLDSVACCHSKEYLLGTTGLGASKSPRLMPPSGAGPRYLSLHVMTAATAAAAKPCTSDGRLHDEVDSEPSCVYPPGATGAIELATMKMATPSFGGVPRMCASVGGDVVHRYAAVAATLRSISSPACTTTPKAPSVGTCTRGAPSQCAIGTRMHVHPSSEYSCILEAYRDAKMVKL